MSQLSCMVCALIGQLAPDPKTFMRIQLSAAVFALSQPVHAAIRRRFRALHIEPGNEFSTLMSRLPNGRLDGPYMIIHTDVDACQMQYYLSGARHGTYVKYERGIARMRAGCMHNQFHGVFEQWYDDGQPMLSYICVHSKIHGEYKTWMRDGTHKTCSYDHGKLVDRVL